MGKIDPEGRLIKTRNHRYRNSCWPVHYEVRIDKKSVIQTLYTKDLSLFRKNLSRVVLIDNSLFSFALQPDNGIPIADWRGEVLPNLESSKIESGQELSDSPPLKPSEELAALSEETGREAPVVEALEGKVGSILNEKSLTEDINVVNEESCSHPENDVEKIEDEEQKTFGDFYLIKKTLEELKNVEDVKPILRSKYRLVDHIIRRCISGMITSSRP